MRKSTCYNYNKEGNLTRDCRGPRKPRRNPEQGNNLESQVAASSLEGRGFLKEGSDKERSEPLQVSPKLVNCEI